MTFVLGILCSVSSGILSQRMFVMLPCGGVGVRENSRTAPKCSKALNERDIKKEKKSVCLMKDGIVSKTSDRSHGTHGISPKTGY